MSKSITGNPGLSCPHCGDQTIVRSSEQVTPIVREVRGMCKNIDCGFAFVAQLAIIRTIRPSALANAQIVLPTEERKPPANDDAPVPANDPAIGKAAAAP